MVEGVSKTACKYTKLFFCLQVVFKKIFLKPFIAFCYLCKRKNNTIMFNKNIKLAITALLVIIAVWQFTEGNIGNGIFLLLLAGLVVLLYFKNE